MSKAKLARVCALAVAVSAGAVLSGNASAATLYDQPNNMNGTNASQNDVGGFGNFVTLYDNFTLLNTASVTEVDWAGFFFNPAQQAPITQFTVKFLADSAGQPGGILSSFTILGNANELSAGNDNNASPMFTYSASLPGGFVATGGTQYWMSIVPDMTYPPQWGWESAHADGVAYREFFGARSELEADMAFTLKGEERDPGTPSVPLPASVYGALPVMAGLALRRRSRR
jgi:hypothetical protein